MYYAAGSYYIGTDKGLCIYNQIVYSNFDTSNSGLPSNKVTYIISYPSPYTHLQELWVGTDKGLALYTGGQWTKFDTSVIHIPAINVSGILPCPAYYMNRDSTVWISTLGSGLIKLNRDGRYKVYNTVSGNFADDTLFYIAQRIGCGYSGDIVMGTADNGICYYVSYGDSFSHTTQGYSYSGPTTTFHSSRLLSQYYQDYFDNQTIATTDEGIYYLAGHCVVEGIPGINKDASIRWHQENNERLWIDLSAINSDRASITLYDIAGHKVMPAIEEIAPASRCYINISGLASGTYILDLRSETEIHKLRVIIAE